MPLPKLCSRSLPHVSVRLQQIFLLPWWEHVSNKFSLNPGTQKGRELQIHHGLLVKTLSLAVHSDTWKSLPCQVLCFFSQTSDLASLWQPLRSNKSGQPLVQLFTYTAMRIRRCCSPWIHWLAWVTGAGCRNHSSCSHCWNQSPLPLSLLTSRHTSYSSVTSLALLAWCAFPL